MSDILRWLRRRSHHLWIIARYDSTAFAELASGLALILLRGILLILVPERFWPFDVSGLLIDVGLNEDRWGTILLIFGALQIVLAGSSHYVSRIILLLGIMASFVTVGVCYALAGLFYSATQLSIICLTSFYTVLLVRVLHDRADRRGHQSRAT